MNWNRGINKVAGVNWTDRISGFDGYVIKDGVVVFGEFVKSNTSVVYGTSSNEFYAECSLVGSHGGWINVDLTSFDTLKVRIKCSEASYPNYWCVCGYADESTLIDNLVGIAQASTSYSIKEFDISSIDEIKALSLYVKNNTSSTHSTTLYVSDMWLE